MRPVKQLTFLILALIILVTACKKDHAPAPPPEKYDSFRINLNFPLSQIGQSSAPGPYEMIISETGGRVVLDTVAMYNAPIITWLRTNQKLLDITLIRKLPATAYTDYVIHSYKAIDLTGWVNIPENDSLLPATGIPVFPPPVVGMMTYTHVNVPLGAYYNVLAGGSGVSGQDYGTFGTFLYGRYNASPGDYAYLVFPQLGLYNLHRITGTNDSVDFSTPATTTTISLSHPATYKNINFSIAGYPDANDLAHTVNLTYYTGAATPIPDLTEMVYPGKGGFPKYYFSCYVSDEAGAVSASVNLPYVDTVPANLPIPDPSWYITSLKADTSIQVNFTTHKPTYYNVTSHVGNMPFTLTAPGDSTLLHPVAFYRSLKSKLLSGVSFSTMQFDAASIVTDAQPDYQAYWVGHTQLYQLWKTPSSANITFQRHF